MRTRSLDELVAHVVWAVKGRRPVLHEADDARRIRLLSAKAHDAKAVLLAAGCAFDHVHVLVRFTASLPLSHVVKHLKGASSRAESVESGEPFRWQDGCWARSCNPDDLQVVRAYVVGQREHHAANPAPEPWELEFDFNDE